MSRALARGLLACAVLSSSVAAAPHKILVLPLEGNAPAALRKALGAEVTSLAQSLGALTPGDTTFSDTADAVGCDPAKPRCVDTVMSTLGVDELIWGTATTQAGTTTVEVYRAHRGQPPQTATVTLAAHADPDTARPELARLFPSATTATTTTGETTTATTTTGETTTATTTTAETTTTGPTTEQTGPTGPGPLDTTHAPATPATPGVAGTSTPAPDHDRTLGLGLSIGGGIALLVGFSLWLEASSVQGDIDGHPTNTLADFQDLAALENKAGNYATAGNVMAFLGVGVGAAGAYYLWKAHGHITSVAPAPAAQGTGMTLTIGGRW